MKVLKVIGGIILGIVLLIVAIGGGMALYYSPASANDVCKNLFKVSGESLKEVTGSTPDQAAIEKMTGFTMKECVDDTNNFYKKSERGLLYKQVLSKCEVKATTLKEYQGCEDVATTAVDKVRR